MCMSVRTWTDDELRNAVQKDYSMRQVLITLGLAPYGGSYATLRKYIKKFGLDTSHWKGQSANKGRKFGTRYPLSDYLTLEGSRRMTNVSLKNRLIKENIFAYKCDICKITEWQGRPLALHLHHRNGNNLDNRLENLQILCPNCHSQTDNYCSTKLSPRPRRNFIIKKTHCKNCGKDTETSDRVFCSTKCRISFNKDNSARLSYSKVCEYCKEDFYPYSYRQKFCSSACYHNMTKGLARIDYRKVARPSLSQLESEVDMNGYCAVGRKYGVSDNAIRKWIKSYKQV